MTEQIKAIHKGSFSKDFGIDVECYVLDDNTKTAVISQRGMATAIGFTGKGGNNLTRFVDSKTMVNYIGSELREKLDQPIVFEGLKTGSNPNSVAPLTHGYDVTILIDICKSIIDADKDGKLNTRQHNLATQANVIVGASAKLGIQQLVYALSGYEAERQEIIENFRVFVRNEAREYEREFPEQLYEEWYRIYELPKPEKNRPWKFMHLTNEHVYYPLAKSKGKLQELVNSQRGESKKTYKRLHQFLSEIGVKALRQHLGQLLGIAQLSNSKKEYESNVKKVFGETRTISRIKDNKTIDMFDFSEKKPEELSSFDQKLKTAIEFNPNDPDD